MARDRDSIIPVLGLSGSLRNGSYSTAVLRTLAESTDALINLRLFSLHSVPLYNQDIDGEPTPPVVRELRAAVRDSAGLIVCSPEYNYGMPGVLKNAIDWISRPALKSALVNKPVLLMTCSPAYTGGARAHAQMRETFSACLARVLSRPQVVIAAVNDKVVDGRLRDGNTLSFAIDAVRDLISEVRMLAYSVQIADGGVDTCRESVASIVGEDFDRGSA